MFIAAASLSYLGPFSGPYRDELLATWIQNVKELDIKVSSDYSLTKTFGLPIEIRNWRVAGLGDDKFSIESAIIV